MADVQFEISRAEKKLSNEKFLAKAPPDVVEKERAKLAVQKEKIQSIQERLNFLSSL